MADSTDADEWKASFLDAEHRPITVNAEGRDEAISKAREEAGCMVASVSKVE